MGVLDGTERIGKILIRAMLLIVLVMLVVGKLLRDLHEGRFEESVTKLAEYSGKTGRDSAAFANAQ